MEVGEAQPKAGSVVPRFTLAATDAVNEGILSKDVISEGVQAYPAATEAILSEQTVTVYSTPAKGVSYQGKGQEYLENRVSYSYSLDKTDGDTTVTYYSYDPHGNVQWLVQDIPGLFRNYVQYEYDLISGKVLRVNYNLGRADQFFHRYGYDEDNRLIKVETSRDGKVWDQDANYAYYAHGPLKRTGLGEDKVQGLDYIYTLQGWLKGINSPVADTTLDLGQDGRRGSAFAPDEWGMSLGYYRGDYKHQGSVFESSATNRFTSQPDKDLYNGNIATWISQMTSPSTGIARAEAQQFRYDRLNRLKESRSQAFNGTTWQHSTAYRTNYNYDGGGNLLNLNRYDDRGISLDSLKYEYNLSKGKVKNNWLEKVTDLAKATSYAEDIEDSTRYSYDRIGNLVADSKEGVTIGWNVYGKVSGVTPKISSTKPTIHYRYDAAGNRVLKQVVRGDSLENTFYVRDAQGNILSLYRAKQQKLTQAGTSAVSYKISLQQTEVPLYGSGRLGEFRADSTLLSGQFLRVDSMPAPLSGPYSDTTGIRYRLVGHKSYELKDHLGNVRVVVGDEKEAHIVDNTIPVPTYTYRPGTDMSLTGNGSVTLKAGQIGYVLAGNTFTGNLTLNGGQLIIQGDASPASLTLTKGETVVMGSLQTASLQVNGGATLRNYGTIQVNSVALNSTLRNYGTLTVNGSVMVNGGGNLDNQRTLSIRDNLTLNNTLENEEQITVGMTTTVNGGGKLSLMASSSLSTGSLDVKGIVTGARDGYSSLQVKGNVSISGGGRLDGQLAMCQTSGTYSSKGYVGTLVKRDCFFTPPSVPAEEFSYWIRAAVRTQYDYYPFGMIRPNGSYTAEGANTYRFAFNGKEKDPEFSNNYDYGFRIYNPNIAKFLSVDPLEKKYPWYTPYQFAGNMPIKYIDLDGLEPAEPGTEKGEYRVATKQGTNQEFGYTWSAGTDGKCNWNQGSILSYTNGTTTRQEAVQENGDQGDLQASDDPSYPNPNIARLDLTQPDFKLRNNMLEGILAGTAVTDSRTATQLMNHFVNGEGRNLTFLNGSTPSTEIATDPGFTQFANNFENAALAFFREKGSLDGFPGQRNTENRPHFTSMRQNLYLATIIGGTQGIRAQIRVINSSEIHVNYTIYDVFGAGRNDAGRWQFPGLQSMYTLQHYRNVNENNRNLYRPYFLGVNISR